MLTLQTWLLKVRNEETGASLVEYALLLVLIAIVAIAAIALVGQDVNSAFTDVANTL